MDSSAVAGAVKDTLQELLVSRGLDLAEIICRYEGGGLFLRILVDWPEGGITLSECAELNKEISSILDDKQLLEQRYVLEVSSPGLDRPLKTKNDFLRCKNKRVRFFLNDLINGKLEWDGIIDNANEESVFINREGKILEIPLSKINKAKQVL